MSPMPARHTAGFLRVSQGRAWLNAFSEMMPQPWELKQQPPHVPITSFQQAGCPRPHTHTHNSLLIMFTSLAPSPMASVMAFLYLFTRSTTMAFCLGVTRQQMTALHSQARSTKFFCRCSFFSSSRLLLCVRIRRSSSVLGNFSFRILLLLVFFSRRISFCDIRGRKHHRPL